MTAGVEREGTDRAVKVWSCATCGPSKRNRATWCALGCGSDYNEMTEYALVPPHALAQVEAERDALRERLDEMHVAYVVASNPGIDPGEVRALRSGRAASGASSDGGET